MKTGKDETKVAAAGMKAAKAKPEKPPKVAGAAGAAGPVATAELEEAKVLRKKALVERVAEVAGVKRKEARAVVEATLSEIGAALSRGEGLVLPPLGKAKINRQKDVGTSEVLVLRLRRGGKDAAAGGGGDADGGLAASDD